MHRLQYAIVRYTVGRTCVAIQHLHIINIQTVWQTEHLRRDQRPVDRLTRQLGICLTTSDARSQRCVPYRRSLPRQSCPLRVHLQTRKRTPGQSPDSRRPACQTNRRQLRFKLGSSFEERQHSRYIRNFVVSIDDRTSTLTARVILQSQCHFPRVVRRNTVYNRSK